MRRLEVELIVDYNIWRERRRRGEWGDVIGVIARDGLGGCRRCVWRERKQVGRQGLSHSPWRPADNVLTVRCCRTER